MDDLAGRVILRISHDRDSTTVFGKRITLRNRINCVVSAFGLNVRTNLADDRADVKFRKNQNRINVGQRGDNFSALPLWHDRTTLPLQLSHGTIRIDCDHKLSA